MSHNQALSALSDPELDKRLAAARTLALGATPADAARLQEALATEKVVWVRTALRQAILRASKQDSTPETTDESIGEVVSVEAFEQIKTIATSAVTRQIVHEIAPVLGVLRLFAKDEISNFEDSRTKRQIDRLADLLRALDRLSRAANAPVLEEFDLSTLAHGVVEAETTGHKVRVDLAGPTPLVVIGDPTLVVLTLANGVRNAIEAVEQLHATSEDIPPVVVNWGETDRDVWIAVLDKGPGPPSAAGRAFEIGTTTKKGHLGMGLATAQQAATSLGGAVTLGLRSEEGGARFEVRWPRMTADL